jgi:hypothetical protein
MVYCYLYSFTNVYNLQVWHWYCTVRKVCFIFQEIDIIDGRSRKSYFYSKFPCNNLHINLYSNNVGWVFEESGIWISTHKKSFLFCIEMRKIECWSNKKQLSSIPVSRRKNAPNDFTQKFSFHFITRAIPFLSKELVIILLELLSFLQIFFYLADVDTSIACGTNSKADKAK